MFIANGTENIPLSSQVSTLAGSQLEISVYNYF